MWSLFSLVERTAKGSVSLKSRNARPKSGPVAIRVGAYPKAGTGRQSGRYRAIERSTRMTMIPKSRLGVHRVCKRDRGSEERDLVRLLVSRIATVEAGDLDIHTMVPLVVPG